MIIESKAVLFDFDGTLHDSTRVYVPAFKEAYAFLEKEGHVPKKVFSDDAIKPYIGMTRKEMWDTFLPDLDEALKVKAGKILGEVMRGLLASGNGVLYDGATSVLGQLKAQGYKLFLLSNCTNTYLEVITQAFSLNSFFDGLYCAEQLDWQPKHRIISRLLEEKVIPENTTVVGDRIHDMEGGKKNNLVTIGCKYGFGSKEELKDATYQINAIGTVLNFL